MVDFVKKNWQFRDIITEGELNRIEDGIEEGITKAEQANQKAQQAQQTANQAASDLGTHLNEITQKFLNVDLNIIDMAVELEILKDATLNGVTANIFIETFQNLDDINLERGSYNQTQKRLEV